MEEYLKQKMMLLKHGTNAFKGNFVKGTKVGEVEMSLDEVIRCLGINFLLMGYLVCATLVHIAINSSKILKQLEKMDKDKQEGR